MAVSIDGIRGDVTQVGLFDDSSYIARTEAKASIILPMGSPGNRLVRFECPSGANHISYSEPVASWPIELEPTLPAIGSEKPFGRVSPPVSEIRFSFLGRMDLNSIRSDSVFVDGVAGETTAVAAPTEPRSVSVKIALQEPLALGPYTVRILGGEGGVRTLWGLPVSYEWTLEVVAPEPP